jgi:hypothetical protein
LAGAASVLAAVVGPLVVLLGLGAGIGLQLAFPGDFGPGLTQGGPATATWIAAAGGVVAIVVGLVLGRRIDARGWLAPAAVVLFCVPVAVHGLHHWSPAAAEDPHSLTPGLVSALRTDVSKRAVVFSDLETSYRISAFAPVYVAAAPPAHVADTHANDPYRRRFSVNRFFASGRVAILDLYQADWLVVDRQRFQLRPKWPLEYEDARYALYHRPA